MAVWSVCLSLGSGLCSTNLHVPPSSLLPDHPSMLNVPLGSTTALVPVVCGLFALNSVYTPFHTYYIHADHYWNEKLLVLTVLKIWLYHDEGGVWSGLEPCGRSSLWQLFFSQRQHTHVQQQLWYGNTYGTQYHTVPQATLCNTDSHTPWPSNALSTAG